jgi:galactonate dehydratase
MKVTEMATTVVGTPWRELTFIELVTDDGRTGVAEARMANRTGTLLACIGELGERYVVGRDPFDTEDLVTKIERDEYWRPGEVTATTLALFEVACFDLVGQALGEPVYRLLGGAVRQRVPAYANGWYQAERDPDEVALRAAAVVERGYRALKLDPFGAARSGLSQTERRRSAAIVSAVRDAVGDDVAIMVEMHGRFSPVEAVRAAEALEPYEVEWVEEPTFPESAAALETVRQYTSIPIATGERLHHLPELREFLERGVVDIVQVDLTHAGGFLNMKRIAGWAGAYYRQLAPHNVCGPVGTMANLHFAACTPNVKVIEHFNDFADPWVAELVDFPPRVDPDDGCFAVPERPGLGVKLNHDACRRHPRTGGRLELFSLGWEKRGQPGPAEPGQHRPGGA